MQNYRLVVRGTTDANLRIRRVRTIEAANLVEAWGVFAEVRDDMSHGLARVSYSVLPETGVRLDGTLSKGYEAV